MSAMEKENALTDTPHNSGVETRMWDWKGYNIRYKVAGEVRHSFLFVLLIFLRFFSKEKRILLWFLVHYTTVLTFLVHKKNVR